MINKKYITSILPLLVVVMVLGSSSYIYSGTLYTQYSALWDYRRVHPDIMPSTASLKLMTVGHDTTYADTIWIRLIQFIGDNIGNGKYLDFTHVLLTQVQELHPHFARAYELDLLLLPLVSDDDRPQTQVHRQTVADALAHYESIMPQICDMTKVSTIVAMGFGAELWSRDDLRDPCISGLIPYYMAAHYDYDLHDPKQASNYYKIASMHRDAPGATRFLGVLALSSDGNYHDGALTFALIASSGYDDPPYLCQTLAVHLANDLTAKVAWTPDWIETLERAERQLKNPANPKNPLSLAGGTCYEWLERGIKQVYLGYVTDRTRILPEVTTGTGLIESGILDHIPTIQSQSGFTLKTKDNRWNYRQP